MDKFLVIIEKTAIIIMAAFQIQKSVTDIRKLFK